MLRAVHERVAHRTEVCGQLDKKIKLGFNMMSHLQKGAQAFRAEQFEAAQAFRAEQIKVGDIGTVH